MNELKLRSFGQTISGLVCGQDLTREAAYHSFSQVLDNAQPDLHQGAFLATLAAKGETVDEITGAWQAIDEHDTNHVSEPLGDVVDNCGTGMDRIKTFNVSTASAIVAASCGVPMARHGARALSSANGTVDILEELGVDVMGDVDSVAASIRAVGIGIFNGTSPLVHPQALGRILAQIRFGSSLNIAASLANPARPTRALRGVHSLGLLKVVPEVMREIGYQRAMVVHGLDQVGQSGMDELSTLGSTLVRELMPDGHIERYRVDPKELGLSQANKEDLAPLEDRQEEVLRFLRVLAGVGPRKLVEFVALNTAGILRVAQVQPDWAQGIQQALEILESKQALARLRVWLGAQGQQNAEQHLNLLCEQARI